MRIFLVSFIGIAINIWTATRGGGGFPPSTALRQRDTALILQRNGEEIYTRG